MADGKTIGEQKDIVVSINLPLDGDFVQQIEERIDRAIGSLGFSRSGTVKGDEGQDQLIYFQFGKALLKGDG